MVQRADKVAAHFRPLQLIRLVIRVCLRVHRSIGYSTHLDFGGLPRNSGTIFTARRNARIASAVLATAIPSVCLSVTRRYCVKTTAHSTVQFALSESKMCLVL